LVFVFFEKIAQDFVGHKFIFNICIVIKTQEEMLEISVFKLQALYVSFP